MRLGGNRQNARMKWSAVAGSIHPKAPFQGPPVIRTRTRRMDARAMA